MIETPRPAGNIYDLGYRPYEGERLGRQYALVALFTYSFKAVFGLGRSGWNKVFPMGLAIMAILPAFLQLSFAALTPVDITLVEPQSYFSLVWWVVPLFAAVVTPEIIGRDHRNRTLPLYFSRTLSRFDYISAKVGALFVAIFLVLAAPQLFLLVGNAFGTDDVVGYLWDNLRDIPPILATSALAAAFMSAISLAIASQTDRRGLATGAVIASVSIFTLLGQILLATVPETGSLRAYTILVSPLDVLNGMTYFMFGATPPPEAAIARTDLAGVVYLLATLAYTAVALAWVYRRFLRLLV